jgi:hypothetical protein
LGRQLSRVVAAALAFALCGCGGGIGNLSGKVTYKGKTVASGTVVCIGADGIARYSKIDADGSYKIFDLPTGEAKLGVNSPNPLREASPLPEPEKLKTAGTNQKPGKRDQENPIPSAPTSDPKLWFELPASVGDAAKSKISTNVTRGENTFNIDIPD